MNKKIAGEIAVGIILILVIVIGGIFWMQGKKEVVATQTESKSATASKKVDNVSNNLMRSDYGISFQVPTGWHIWEGNSAALDLMNKTDLASVLESGASALTSQKVKEYQTFMDSWKVESSEAVVFTNSGTLDYKNRSFANAGKIMSRIVDSEDILKQREVKMNIFTAEVNLAETPINDETKEIRNIKIGNRDAQLLISKKMKLVDWVIIKMPIKSSKTISGKNVSSLVFMEYVKKNTPNSVNDLTSLILSLGVTDNQ